MQESSCDELDSGQISETLDRFEAAWQAGNRPDISLFLSQAAEGERSHSSLRRLAMDLVMIDLDYRWRAGEPSDDQAVGQSHDSSDSSDSHSENSNHDSLPARPSLEDYVAHLTVLGPVCELPIDLVAEEFRVRSSAGEDCQVAMFRQRFPHLGDGLQSALDDALERPYPVTVKIYHERKRVFTFHLEHRLEIGRQRPDEPPPYTVVETENGSRLVVAALSERYLSRRHLSLELCDDGRVRIANLSAKNPIVVPHQQQTIAPGKSDVYEVPTLLIVEHKAIRLLHE